MCNGTVSCDLTSALGCLQTRRPNAPALKIAFALLCKAVRGIPFSRQPLDSVRLLCQTRFAMPRRKRGVLVDATDARIMSQLATDGSALNVDIAKAAGLSETAVRCRLERLINTHVLTVAARIDPEAVGYRVNAILNLQVHFGHAEEIGNRLAQEANVRYVAISLGQDDLVAWTCFRSNGEMMDFVANRVRSIPGVHSCQLYPLLGVLRCSEGWNPLAQGTVRPDGRPSAPGHCRKAPAPGAMVPSPQAAARAATAKASHSRRPSRQPASA